MGENPSNFYNDNVKYANPPSGGCNWDLDYYRTNYINAILLGQLKEGNYIKSGLVPTQGTGLNIEVTAGVAVIGGVEFEVNAFTKQAVLAPLGSVEFNLVYIDSSGVGQVIQSDPSAIGCALAIVDTDDTTILRFMDARQLLQYDTTPNPVFQNHIVDGDFNFWYEGISQTGVGYGSDTMWLNSHVGTTKTHSQQLFAIGQSDVPGNLDYFSRTIVNSVAGASNFCDKQHNIENVKKLSNKTIAFSFWAKADSAKNIAVEFVQDFGTGGSPSADVGEIGVQKIALTTAWTKYTINVDIPSISGKTFGTDGNDHTKILIWFEAGNDFNSRTDSLGQQSGTFDLARVRLVEGEEDGDHISEDYEEVLRKINRFFWYGEPYGTLGYQWAGNISLYSAARISFGVEMRAVPSVAEITAPVYTNCTFGNLVAKLLGFEVRVTPTSAGIHFRTINGIYSADSRL